MKKKIFISLFILIHSLSCKTDLKNEKPDNSLSTKEVLISKDYDQKITTEFIKQLLEKEKAHKKNSFLNPNCILEKSKWKLTDKELKLYLGEQLKITDKDFLQLQIDLFNKFIITRELLR
ncbi:hypothetical protein [Tenacibaculum sp. nBUS_03]|uniref:hypothetical protein n=1 Tax=Tenacibaculum sp. nBUS_03 TaxID=3395320 RepID=UPI003EBFCEA1